MIPDFVDGVLPAGEHLATWDEITTRFGTTSHRRHLLDGLHGACSSLASAGCVLLWLNGSFVTDKPWPNDFDACWDPAGVDLDAIDPVLLDLAHPRTAQKERYGGELFPNVEELASGSLFVDFFQTDLNTGLPKGIIVLDLRSFLT
ncbi:MAG TPA: hypothetical protein VM142_09180 [Acidimicrobiales bacterium]|nr:hypothetical protein [Acidimicrobiales bacterium]